MKPEYSSLIAILTLAILICGCTSSVPEAADVSGNTVSTTRTSQTQESNPRTTLLEFQSDLSGNQFVNGMRQWKDNENRFSINAELLEVSIRDRSIKLLKENGITIDVPVDRLSRHDRNFLTQAIYAMRKDLVKEEPASR